MVESVNHNGTYNCTVLDGGTSLCSRFKTKAHTVNSDILVTEFGAIYGCQDLFWNPISRDTVMEINLEY